MGTAAEASLTADQAEKLLAPLGAVSVTDVAVAATTNDVFRVRTRGHGTYYVKFHTAAWYADHADAYFVVERECAVAALLAKRGLTLPYRAWGDFTREVVPRSVFISGELGGLPVPEALAQYRGEQAGIVRALGRYMARLHAIEFGRAGFIASPHAHFAPAEGPVPTVYSWDRQAYHNAETLQRDALALLEREASRLPAAVVPRLRELFASLVEAARDDYRPPRFTVANCHAQHFHVERRDGAWEVLGFYDFEAASAGAPACDLAELELELTPAVGGAAWREPFFEEYGRWPVFESHKRRVLAELVFRADKRWSGAVPDPAWLEGAWMRLIEARDWPELRWYPEGM